MNKFMRLVGVIVLLIGCIKSSDAVVTATKVTNGVKPWRSLKGYDLDNSQVAFSPDGRWLAVTGINSATVTEREEGRLLKLESQTQSVKVWETSTWKLVATLGFTENGGISDLAFSPDSNLLAISCNSRLNFYKTTNWKLSRTLTSQHTVKTMAFSPDGKQLAVGYDVKVAKLWRTSDWKELHILKATGGVNSFSFSPDSETLAIGLWNGTVDLWNTITAKQIRSIEHQVSADKNSADYISVTFSPDGKLLATSCWKYKTVKLWDASTGQQVRSIEGGGTLGIFVLGVDDIVFSPDSKKLVIASASMKLWDVATGQVLYTFSDINDGLSCYDLVFSPNGKLLATSSRGATVDLWKVP